MKVRLTFSGEHLRIFIKLCILGFILGVISFVAIIAYYSRGLPDPETLAKYEPSVTSRLYAASGDLLDEYAKDYRLYVPINSIPKKLQNAFIAAEDSNFYSHIGIDIESILAAMVKNVFRYKDGKSLVGASTITQQVVKNILLSKERTLSRKIKEAILSIRITKVLSKERVLELYLNEIYLGNHAYGVAAAALNYFDKSLNELTLDEMAFLAALPKAPSYLDPRKNYTKAIVRRNWVLDRMNQDGFITKQQMVIAKSTKIILKTSEIQQAVNAGSYSESVRKEVVDMFGEKKLLEGGLLITGTLDPKLQAIAYETLRKGIYNYDRRRGYRGPYKKFPELVNEGGIGLLPNWQNKLKEVSVPVEVKSNDWALAIVLSLQQDKANIGFADGSEGYVTLADFAWAKKLITVIDPETEEKVEEWQNEITHPAQVVGLGDVIVVGKSNYTSGKYFLRQIPEVNGAIVAINPHDGRVMAMVGGYNDSKTEFNRAVQALRQPGSIVKPFTYLAALERGFMPTTIIVDDEIRMKKSDGSVWIPKNYSGKMYGLTPMRIGLEKSRNITTVRLAEMVGLNRVADVFDRYELPRQEDLNYSLVLGSNETNLLSITRAYAMIANGGKKINPEVIEKIQDKEGKVIYKRDKRDCVVCVIPDEITKDDIVVPELEDDRKAITDPRVAYQMISLLEGVVQRGTGWRAKTIHKPIAGKTGTTNDSFDAWFMGFSADLAVGVWVGYDSPRSLGKKETGSSVTVPIFVDFMKQALADRDARPFNVPEGIKFVKIDRFTGKPPLPSTPKRDIIFEAIKAENLNNLSDDKATDSDGNIINDNDYGSSIY